MFFFFLGGRGGGGAEGVGFTRPVERLIHELNDDSAWKKKYCSQGKRNSEKKIFQKKKQKKTGANFTVRPAT